MYLLQLNSDWFIEITASVVIGQTYYFGFGFTTLLGHLAHRKVSSVIDHVTYNVIIFMKISRNSPFNFRVTLSLFFKPRPSTKHSYGYKLYLDVKENSYPYKWLCTWPQFEKEGKSNSEMGYSRSFKRHSDF